VSIANAAVRAAALAILDRRVGWVGRVMVGGRRAIKCEKIFWSVFWWRKTL
jgi:hypothetical protein